MQTQFIMNPRSSYCSSMGLHLRHQTLVGRGLASFDSVRHKIARAQLHLNSFAVDSNKHFNQGAVEVTADFDFPNNVLPTLSADVPVPPELPLIIGDCLQNIRSALDYFGLGIGTRRTRQTKRKTCVPRV